MTFEKPIKGDIDRALSLLMHANRHKLMEECNRVKSEAVKAGALQGSRVVVMVAKAADDLHKEAMTEATAILLDFVQRMERPPKDIVDWARPHLENLSNSLLGVVPPNNLPRDHQRLTQQYRAVFQQRVDGVLRDVEIGYVKGQGFIGIAKTGSKTEKWISSAGKRKPLRVFLCHASDDKASVRDLYKLLRRDGFEPWLDEEDLVPGQDWEAEIRKAVRNSGAVLVCLSSRSLNKEGFVQKEIKFALDCADEKPPGTIFLIPAKLEECPVPDRLSHWHWVNLAEQTGYNRLLHALRTKADAPGPTPSRV